MFPLSDPPTGDHACLGHSIAPCYTNVNPSNDQRGRPRKFSLERFESILIAVRAARPLRLAAQAEGVDLATLHAWLRKPTIAQRVAQAQLDALEPAINTLRGRATFDPNAAAALVRLVLGEGGAQ